MAPNLDPAYWNQRYQEGNTPWDMGSPSPSLLHLASTYADVNDRLLIPGAGRAHELTWLLDNGYAQTFICDWAPEAIADLRSRFPHLPAEQLILADYFELSQSFDLILEQTFFCAIDPARRPEYVRKTYDLLKPGGAVGGLLFAVDIPGKGPPYGGDREEYIELFQPWFTIEILEISPYSIPPRAGTELLFLFRKEK